MAGLKDIDEAKIARIQTPALVINGVRAEQALKLSRMLRNASLAIYEVGMEITFGEICSHYNNSNIPAFVTARVEAFLNE